MSIRPVDLQVLLPRAQEANQAHNNVNNHAAGNQAMFAQTLREQVETENRTVLRTKESENPNVDKDGKGNGAAGDGKKRKEKPESRERKAAIELTKDKSMIDIQV